MCLIDDDQPVAFRTGDEALADDAIVRRDVAVDAEHRERRAPLFDERRGNDPFGGIWQRCSYRGCDERFAEADIVREDDSTTRCKELERTGRCHALMRR